MIEAMYGSLLFPGGVAHALYEHLVRRLLIQIGVALLLLVVFFGPIWLLGPTVGAAMAVALLTGLGATWMIYLAAERTARHARRQSEELIFLARLVNAQAPKPGHTASGRPISLDLTFELQGRAKGENDDALLRELRKIAGRAIDAATDNPR